MAGSEYLAPLEQHSTMLITQGRLKRFLTSELNHVGYLVDAHIVCLKYSIKLYINFMIYNLIELLIDGIKRVYRAFMNAINKIQLKSIK